MRVLLFGIVVAVLVGCAESVPPSLIVPASGPCAGIPVIPRDQPFDAQTLTTDPTLEAKFPKVIDGHPVTDVSSGRWVETLCLIGGDTLVDAANSSAPDEFDLTNVSVASGQGTVDGLGVTITAYRLPSSTGSDLIPAIGMISSSVTGQDPKFTGGLTAATAGGKSVMTWTNPSDGSTSYLYPVGDTLFIVEHLTPSQADKVFAALP